jgi:segregation and condensation protein B
VTPLAQLLEAALFSAARPLTAEELSTLDQDATLADVRVALEQIREHYDFEQHGVELVEMAGGYQVVTRPVHAAAIERAQFSVRAPKLTAAALETLAVIAYRQPVTAPEIAEIRGVNTAGVVGTLVERRLVKIVGRKQVVGRPFLYGTTREFLERFGLNDLSDLPKVEDLSELMGFDIPLQVGEPQPQTALPFEPDGGDGQVH